MNDATIDVRVSAEQLRIQIETILRAWGMPVGHGAVTAERMVEADLRGIDAHGIVMLPLYERLLKDGHLIIDPEVKIVRETPVTGVIDGGGGLGHYPSTLAMNLAVVKCSKAGLAVITVRNSQHYGAAGVYAVRAADHGFIGVSTSAVYRPSLVPTFAAEPRFGTNPIAFAAPTKRNQPFVLDMATSAVAIGKLKLAAFAGEPIPEGWVVDDDGQPVTDSMEALALRRMVPLGGGRESGGHKGYGLAAMVEILSSVLSGAMACPVRDPDGGPLGAQGGHDVGHFFMAIDPAAFREPGDFEDDLDAMIDALRATRPTDPAQPVLVAGDPEHTELERRNKEGIILAGTLVADVKRMASDCDAEFLLTC